MLPPGHCSTVTTGLSISFLFSAHGRSFVYFVVKLQSIISYDQLRYSEPADDILPHKLGDVLIFDGGEGFSFYPFVKVVGDNQQQLFLSRGCL